MKKKWQINNKWISFYFGWHFRISYQLCEYFDARHALNLNLIFFRFQLMLPWKSKYTDECDPPEWGIAIHNNIFWIYKGGKGNMNGGNKWWTWHFPWEYDWIRTSYLKKEAIAPNAVGRATVKANDHDWFHETKGNRLDFWDTDKRTPLWQREYPYTYVLRSGEVQHRTALLTIQEREWRQRWLKWTSAFSKVRRTIDINFSDEVGERTGSWKGGCTGCSYELLPEESPEQCLRRMEAERKFN